MSTGRYFPLRFPVSVGNFPSGNHLFCSFSSMFAEFIYFSAISNSCGSSTTLDKDLKLIISHYCIFFPSVTIIPYCIRTISYCLQDLSEESSSEKHHFAIESSQWFQRSYLLNHIHFFMSKVHFNTASAMGSWFKSADRSLYR